MVPGSWVGPPGSLSLHATTASYYGFSFFWDPGSEGELGGGGKLLDTFYMGWFGYVIYAPCVVLLFALILPYYFLLHVGYAIAALVAQVLCLFTCRVPAFSRLLYVTGTLSYLCYRLTPVLDG